MNSAHVATPARVAGQRESGLLQRLHLDWPWLVSSVLAASLLSLTLVLPLWQMKLEAPQYPQGLTLTAYGTGMEGDISEINALNHYIGVKPIDQEGVLEFKLFPFMIAGLVLVTLAAGFSHRRWVRFVLPVALFGLPVGFLVDLQWWLYRFGHDIDPTSALRFGTFTPKVLGTTTVVNFHSETMVLAGFGAMVAAALVVLVGAPVIRFLRESWSNTGQAATAR